MRFVELLLCGSVAVAATTLILGATTPTSAGYRGFTDQHMIGYVNANRTITIEDGLGGHIEGMIGMLGRIAAADRQVVIDGPCRSACTLLVALGPSRVCLTAKAELWFHQASLATGRRSAYWSNAMLRLYPDSIRNFVNGRGGLQRDWIVLKGRQLARAFPSRCEPAAVRRANEASRPRVFGITDRRTRNGYGK